MTVSQYAASCARYYADVADVGYSQPDRWTFYDQSDWDGWLIQSPANADCSALVAGCYNLAAHHEWGEPFTVGYFPRSTWTGSMRDECAQRNFADISDQWIGNEPDGGFEIGDIVLSEEASGGRGHVAMVTGLGPTTLSEAWIAEDGSIDGYLGDQTGGETRTVAYSSHPHTRKGAWTSCHRFSETKFLAQWPNFAKTAAKPTPTPPKPSGEPAHAHGIDVSSHQAGINIPALWADFVIVKATEDDDYTNPHMNTQATATLNAGKRLGFYHFARPGSATAQARYFVNTIRPYINRATLWLDWEANAPTQGAGWAKTWLDTVASLTGTIPGIYMNGSTVNGYNWTSVAAKYPLWYAGGPNYSSWGKSYTDPAIPSLRYWGQPLIHQYTEDGRLPGYGGKLDLNRLRDRTTWDRMVGKAPANNENTTKTGDDEVLFIYTERNGKKEYKVLRGGFYPISVEGIIAVSYEFAIGKPKKLAPDFYDRTVTDWEVAYKKLVADVAAACAKAAKA